MKLEPLLDRVIAKPFEPVKRTSSALILSDSAQANVCEAEVLWVDEGVNVDSRGAVFCICGPELRALRVKCCYSENCWRFGFSLWWVKRFYALLKPELS
ncbi:10 kDa chaperonin [Candidatus Hodgkinia cicadicola]|nr:10 kDa chaperonin [Candidatus Hodgkinia cicadicola]